MCFLKTFRGDLKLDFFVNIYILWYTRELLFEGQNIL